MSFFKSKPQPAPTEEQQPVAEQQEAQQPSYAFTKSGERFPIDKLTELCILKTSGNFELRPGQQIATDDGKEWEFVSLVPMTGRAASYLLLLPL